MFGRIGRGITALRLLSRCESAFKRGLEAPMMGKTKWGALLAGIGLLCTIGAKIASGDAALITSLPEILAVVGGIVAVFGGRDALAKIGK